MAFAGYQVNIQMDISAEKMIFGVAGVDPKRRDELIKAGQLSEPVKISWIYAHSFHGAACLPVFRYRFLENCTSRLIIVHTVL